MEQEAMHRQMEEPLQKSSSPKVALCMGMWVLLSQC